VILKLASVILLTGLMLDILPRRLFEGTMQDALLEKILANSAVLQDVFVKAEKIYSDYGQKFVLSQCVLFTVFLIVSMSLVIKTAESDLSINPAVIERSDKQFRLLLLVIALLVLFAIQVFFVFHPLNPSGGNSSPMTYRALIWSSMAAAVGAFTALAKKPVKLTGA
jgi:hypothetical protein